MSIELGAKWQEIRNPTKIATITDIDYCNKTYPLKISVTWADDDSSNFSGCGESYRCAEQYLTSLFTPIKVVE